MEVSFRQMQDGMTEKEFCMFIEEGLQDACAGNLLDFDAAFDELEKRYDTDD